MSGIIEVGGFYHVECSLSRIPHTYSSLATASSYSSLATASSLNEGAVAMMAPASAGFQAWIVNRQSY